MGGSGLPRPVYSPHHLETPELGTSQQLQPLPPLEVIDNEERPLAVLGERHQLPAGVEGQRRDLLALVRDAQHLQQL